MDVTTVDKYHSDRLKTFENNNVQLIDRISDLEQKMHRLSVLSNKDLKDLTRIEIKLCHSLSRDIAKSKELINIIKSGKNINEYLLRAGHYINDYYNHIKPRKTILTQYSSKNDKKLPHSRFKRGDCLDGYLDAVDPHYIKKMTCSDPEGGNICKKCNCSRISVPNEAKLICPKCADEVNILIESDRPSYKEPPPENTYFQYKKINHFNEYLANCQGKENTIIPNSVFATVKDEIRKERIVDKSDLTYDRMKDYLKIHKFSRYYDHIPLITSQITEIPSKAMPIHMEEELRTMFRMVVAAWKIYCPLGRKNFLSYPCVCRQCALIRIEQFKELEYNDYLFMFRKLKSPEKRYDQDVIWREVCRHYKWQFFSSL